MYYTINSKEFTLNLNERELLLAQELESEGLIQVVQDDVPVINKNGHVFKVKFEGEGFDLNDIAAYLKKSVKKSSFTIHIEDHKGDDRYVIEFGPGFCSEE